MTLRQFGMDKAWVTHVGSRLWGKGCLVIEFICLGLKMLFMDLVVMECVRLDGGGIMVVRTGGDTLWDERDTSVARWSCCETGEGE